MQPGGARRDRGGVRGADRSGEGALEARSGRAEREPAGAKHLEHELLLALVEPGGRELDPTGGRAQAARDILGTSSRHSAQRSLAPRTVSRYACWSSRVTSPTPSSTSSTARSGVTSAAVPHMNTSSAR